MKVIYAKDIIGKSINVFFHDYKSEPSYIELLDNVEPKDLQDGWDRQALVKKMCKSEDIQNSLAVDAKVEVNYGAFRGTLEAQYKTETKHSYQNDFSLIEDRAFSKRYQLGDGTKPNSKFIQGIQQLDNGKMTVIEFFNTFGTHFVDLSFIGGWFRLWTSIKTSNYSKHSKVKVDTSIEMLSKACASGSLDKESSKVLKECEITAKMEGFSQDLCPIGATELMSLIESGSYPAEKQKAFNDWTNNWQKSEGLVRAFLRPIGELSCLDLDQQRTIKKAYFDYLAIQRLTYSITSTNDGATVIIGDEKKSIHDRGYVYAVCEETFEGLKVELGSSMPDDFRSLEDAYDPGNFVLLAVSKWIVNDHPDKDLFVPLVNDPHNINAWLKYHDGRPMAYSLMGHAPDGVDNLDSVKGVNYVDIEGHLILSSDNRFTLSVSKCQHNQSKAISLEKTCIEAMV